MLSHTGICRQGSVEQSHFHRHSARADAGRAKRKRTPKKIFALMEFFPHIQIPDDARYSRIVVLANSIYPAAKMRCLQDAKCVTVYRLGSHCLVSR